MKELLSDHVIWIVIALLLVLAAYVVLALANKPVDERLISGGVLVLVGALAGLARSNAD